MPSPKLILSIASVQDKQAIYKIRHNIYARELHQHVINTNQQLSDELDVENNYIVARHENEIIGFVSITSPGSIKYSVDKYFSRSVIPFVFDELLYEVRLLTVLKENRNSNVALVLMFAAFRWVQSHGGLNIVAICRRDLIEMYCKAGLKPLGVTAQSGKVTYELSVACIEDLKMLVEKKLSFYEALRNKIDWQLPYLFFAPSTCYHGGSFFKAIGEHLQTLDNAKQIINADVLDAWFPPSPDVLKTIHENLSFLIQTSPPTHAEGLVSVIAEARGIKEQNVLPGAGSSDLIFLSFMCLLNKNSRVLIIDPCYGEYIHVLENVVQCSITRFNVLREEGFVVNTSSLIVEINKGYDMVVLVNPNSPTGVHAPKKAVQEIISQTPRSTIVWLDETYVEFAGASESLEKVAVKTENVIVCKSMSKVYALSGVRVAYLCCSPHIIEVLKQFSPPWSVSLPAQAAAIAALLDRQYYQRQYAATHVLRTNLTLSLQELGVTEIVDGLANFLLFYLPAQFPRKNEFLEACKNKNLFLRDVSNMGKNIGNNAVRIAVKDEATNNRMIGIIKEILVQVDALDV